MERRTWTILFDGETSRPRIILRQNEPNIWEVVLTAEERELIEEFLET